MEEIKWKMRVKLRWKKTSVDKLKLFLKNYFLKWFLHTVKV